MPTAIYTPRVVRANRRVDPERNERFGEERDIRVAHHGWFASWKLRSNIPYRGLDAFHFLCLAEVHPSVTSISSVTDPIPWFDGRDWQDYYPRYSVAIHQHRLEADRHVDVEVMSSLQFRSERRRFARIRRAAREENRHLLVFTERQLNIEPRRTNAKFILSQAGEGLVTEEERSLIMQIASGTGQFCLNDVVATQVLSYPRAYAAALNLVACGDLQFSLGRRFDGSTLMWGTRR